MTGDKATKSENLVTVYNFINGEFREPVAYMDSCDPSTGRVWAKIPASDRQDVDDAYHAAKDAFFCWSEQSPETRSKHLIRIADLVESRLDEFAEAESRDQGKPVWLSRAVDIPRCVHNFRFFATAILHQTEISTTKADPPAVNYVIKQPLGVVGLISPWNLPLYLLSFKLAPALAVGNTVVAKPSEMTSVTAWMLAKVFNDAGLPKGVVNFVFGTGAAVGEAMVVHPHIPAISFTGSTAIGQRINRKSSEFHKKVSLEMGGKNPCIVFADADLKKCIPTCVRSSFTNQGEICLCTSRIFVHNSIIDEFLRQFVEQTKALTVGPAKHNCKLGALISEAHLAKVQGFVQTAKVEGAAILCGEEEMDIPAGFEEGYYMRPTVITNTSDCSSLMQDEVFGPVTCVVPFAEEEEAIIRANVVKYGLCAVVWTKDISRAHRVATKLQTGTVWVNNWLVRDLRMPFGGIKQSGIGREGADASVEFFTEEKTICVDIS